MHDIEPIVWTCGNPEWHEASAKYNREYSRLCELKQDLRDAYEYNIMERFQGDGWFSHPAPNPPISTSGLRHEINDLEDWLRAERKRIDAGCRTGSQLSPCLPSSELK